MQAYVNQNSFAIMWPAIVILSLLILWALHGATKERRAKRLEKQRSETELGNRIYDALERFIESFDTDFMQINIDHGKKGHWRIVAEGDGFNIFQIYINLDHPRPIHLKFGRDEVHMNVYGLEEESDVIDKAMSLVTQARLRWKARHHIDRHVVG